MPSPDLWFRFRKPRPHARLRLVCLPYAGGGAAVFRAWAALMPPEIEVLPVQMPGRGHRAGEPPLADLSTVCGRLADALAPFADRDLALFGHSMGAVIAYETALLLTKRGAAPSHLVVSAHRAPPSPLGRLPLYDLPEVDFVAALRRLGGTPDMVLDDAGLMAQVLPLLRADFALAETWLRPDPEQVPCPVTAFGGRADIAIGPARLAEWRCVTRAPFAVRLFDGGHFFIHSAARDVMDAAAATVLGIP